MELPNLGVPYLLREESKGSEITKKILVGEVGQIVLAAIRSYVWRLEGLKVHRLVGAVWLAAVGVANGGRTGIPFVV